MSAARVLAAGAAAVGLVALGLATPASAATLPPGQRITIVEDAGEIGDAGTFYDVDPMDAAVTPVADPTDQHVYAIELGDDGMGAAIGMIEGAPTIWIADGVAGTLASPQPILLFGETSPDVCQGLDLINTTFIASCVLDDEGVLSSHIGFVDPETGGFIPFITLSDEDYLQFDAIATDTVTAQLWGFAHVAGVSTSFLIDLESDVVTEVAEMDNDVYGADFDRDGQLFVSTEIPLGQEFEFPALAVANPFTGAYVFSEPYVRTDTDTVLIFVEAISVWGAGPEPTPPPQLADTGFEAGTVAAGCMLLVIAGVAVLATSRINRRA